MEKFIAIDVGNTTCDILFFKDENEATYVKLNVNEVEAFFKNQREFCSELTKVKNIYVSSVNLRGLNILISLFNESNFHVINKDIMEEYAQKNNFKIDNISILGSDLFCDIVSNNEFVDTIICDFGTATKILYIDKNKVFHGGIIFPGLRVCNSSLALNTFLLDDYNLFIPENLVSLKTDEAILSGTINGTYFLVEGTINKLIKERKIGKYKIFFTGGNSELLSKVALQNNFKFAYKVNKYLTLQGILNTFNIGIDINNLKIVELM